MIKRPLRARFSTAVLEGRKVTTIREKPWPVGTPIMLYNWSGLAYRSPQSDVAAVSVTGFWTIQITHMKEGVMCYTYGMENAKPLYETEGFGSCEEMDEWFRAVVKPGADSHEVSDAISSAKRANGETQPMSNLTLRQRERLDHAIRLSAKRREYELLDRGVTFTRKEKFWLWVLAILLLVAAVTWSAAAWLNS